MNLDQKKVYNQNRQDHASRDLHIKISLKLLKKINNSTHQNIFIQHQRKKKSEFDSANDRLPTQFQ
ncbi:hypothetical protein HZS_5985 [Henneguya salminicola]|nr:hypothetical protein HZS_5985 [Henneguya salminicola]